MSAFPWVIDLMARRLTLAYARAFRPLTMDEQVELHRIEGLLVAWQEWDMNGHVAALRAALCADVSP